MNKTTYTASNGVSVVMRGNPNQDLIAHALTEAYRKAGARKGEKNAA